MTTRLIKLGTVAGVATAIVALIGTPAAAHVTVTPTTTVAGEYAVLTVSVPHGCDGSGTTKVAIKIPTEINAVTPTLNQGWNVEKVMVPLNPPVKDAHGNELTQRVDQVVYTAKAPLPDGYRDAFELSVKLPDAAGTTLIFPSVQTCEQGETGWVEVPGAGQKADDLEHPAPSFTLTAKDAEKVADAPAAPAAPVASETTDDGESVPAVTWIALAVGVLGLLLGGFAVIRPRRVS